MTVSKDKVVSLIYELRKENPQGEVVESLTKESPLTFLFGNDNLLPKFESELEGLKVGEKFEFTLDTESAYGEVNEKAIIDLPKDIFAVEGKIDESLLQVGNMIPMQDNTGNKLNGMVMEISDNAVKMDFNHPLAGENLHFKGEVTGIRDATNEELSHGHVHHHQSGEEDSCCDSGGCSCG
ncbi:MAG: FKBP-type peptidyl-prolyl cis-trans isomerase [bacterium]